MPRQILSIRRTGERINVHPATVWKYVNDETLSFPRPVMIGRKRVGFHEDEIDAWIAARPAWSPTTGWRARRSSGSATDTPTDRRRRRRAPTPAP